MDEQCNIDDRPNDDGQICGRKFEMYVYFYTWYDLYNEHHNKDICTFALRRSDQ